MIVGLIVTVRTADTGSGRRSVFVDETAVQLSRTPI